MNDVDYSPLYIILSGIAGWSTIGYFRFLLYDKLSVGFWLLGLILGMFTAFPAQLIVLIYSDIYKIQITEKDQAFYIFIINFSILLLSIISTFIFFLSIEITKFISRKNKEIKVKRRENKERKTLNRQHRLREAEHKKEIDAISRFKILQHISEIRKLARMLGRGEDENLIESIDESIDVLISDRDFSQDQIRDATIQAEIKLVLDLLYQSGNSDTLVVKRLEAHLVRPSRK